MSTPLIIDFQQYVTKFGIDVTDEWIESLYTPIKFNPFRSGRQIVFYNLPPKPSDTTRRIDKMLKDITSRRFVVNGEYCILCKIYNKGVNENERYIIRKPEEKLSRNDRRRKANSGR